MKKIVAVILIGIMLMSFVSCQSQTPYIGENGNWWVGEQDLGVAAQGPQGEQNSTDYEFIIGDKLTSSINMPVSFPLYDAEPIIIQEINVVKTEILDMNDFDDYIYDWYDGATFYQYKYTISIKGKADNDLENRYLRIRLYFDGTMSNIETYFDGNLLDNPGGISGSYNYQTNQTTISGCVFKVEADGSFSVDVVGYSNENLHQYSISNISPIY